MKKFVSSILLLLVVLCASAQYDRDAFFLRGRQALYDGKFSKAIESFNILASLDTSDYWNYFFRGIAKYNLGDIRGAQNDFDRSVRINPVFTNGYHYRAISKSRNGLYEDALADLGKAMELRPGVPGLYYSRGVTYFLARRFEDAVSDFNFYIRKESRDPSAYLNRGAANLYLKDTTAALSDYNRAIRLDSSDPEGYIRRGCLYAASGKNGDAVRDLNHALELDQQNTLAYFNRALLHFGMENYNAAMADLDSVLVYEPGNALTLYNRSLLHTRVGNYRAALDDMDRVISINPGNVLAYFNRAYCFVRMERWDDALADYNKAIELYPDFAKAYLNRAVVEQKMGLMKSSKADYETARRKVEEYEAGSGAGALADTSRQFSALMALDADFAKKDFNDEMLQHRDVDIKLRPLYRFSPSDERERRSVALSRRFENASLDAYVDALPIPVVISNADTLYGKAAPQYDASECPESDALFIKALQEVRERQFNAALASFNRAVELAPDSEKGRYARALYLMNRGVLRAEMIDFLASMQDNVQTLSMDDQGRTRARVREHIEHKYDYSEAVADMEAAAALLPGVPYVFFNLGNLHCLSSRMIEAIEDYDNAIKLYPAMGDAYYNRGLVLIFLKDREKGCIDLSRAGELGVKDAYSVISKYCKVND